MSAAFPSKAGGLLPVAGICCLALTGFLIATTIVLALIPIYVPRKDVTVVTVPADSDRFQLGFQTTGSDDDNVAGKVSNLADIKNALGLGDNVDVEDAFVQTEVNSASGRRRRRRTLLQRRQTGKELPATITVKINIKCKYNIKAGCMGGCRDSIKTKVDRAIVAAGPLSVPSLKVNCGGKDRSLSVSRFSYGGITKQPAPLEGFGAVDSLDFTPIASGDINDAKIWKNGVRPFRGCRVNVPSGIKLGISQNPYLIQLDQLIIAKGASLELGTNGGAAFVFARNLSLAISGTFSCLSAGGAVSLPLGAAFQFLAGATCVGTRPVFQIIDYLTGLTVATQNIPLGNILAAIIASITGVIIDNSATATSTAATATTTTQTLSATGIVD